MTTTFKLRTTDRAWIARHGGVTAADGWTSVQVPTDEVEIIETFGQDWLRYDFGDDTPKGSAGLATAILCPVSVLDAPPVGVQRETSTDLEKYAAARRA